MRDRKKYFVQHSTNEWISINGDVKNKILRVRHNTRRKGKATTKIFVAQNTTTNCPGSVRFPSTRG